MRRSILLAAALLVASCAGAEGPPIIAIDRTACAHCSMLISDVRYAAAMQESPGAEAQAYDDIGCLLEAWQSPDRAPDAVAWAMDVDGTWVDVREATFVRGSIRTPMGGGIVAFREREAAEAYASTLSGASVLDFAELTRR